MKTKFLFLGLFFLAIGSLVSAQSWQTGTNILYSSPLSTRVGIGTSSPSEELHVMDNGGTYAWTQATFQSSSSSGGIKFINNGGQAWELQSGRDGDSYVSNKFLIYDRTVGGLTGYRFIIDGSGNVGIGTTSPDSKLEVDGKITCEEVEVKNVSADYVFEKGFSLKTLKEVESFINKNGHLPDVPPASETEKGVNISEFNSLLLQKIEELTLYTIEQQKKIEELQNSILNQKQ